MSHPAILVAAIRAYLDNLHCAQWGRSISIKPNNDEAVEFIADLFAGVDVALGRIVDGYPVRTVHTGGQP